MVRNCHVYGGQNRAFDLVEAWDTERPNSNAVLIGNFIQMDPNGTGNRNVIHFGQEKGKRNGSLYLIDNTIETSFISPIALIDSSSGGFYAYNNLVRNQAQSRAEFLSCDRSKTNLTEVVARGNSIPVAYGAWATPELAQPALDVEYVDGEGRTRRSENGFRFVAGEWKPATGAMIGAGG
jgi:hypothetical protein